MPIQMYKGKNSKVVSNRDVGQHRKDGWTFKPSKTALQQKISKPKKPRATLKVKEDDVKIVEPKINIDLPGPEDFNLNIKE
jgi:hypothetical protein